MLLRQYEDALLRFLAECESAPPAMRNVVVLPISSPTSSVAARPARNLDSTEQRLLQIWRDVLQRDSIAPDDRFFDVGGDSLRAARLFTKIEAQFGVKLAVTELLQRPTVATLALALRNEPAPDQPSCLIPLQPNGSRPPIFCVHAREGDALPFRNFPNYLGPDQPVFGLQARSLNGGTPHVTVEEMAEHYIKEVRRIQPTGPYHFFGYCFGGSIAFEMALQLEASGERTALLSMYYPSPPRSLGVYLFPVLASLPDRISRKWQRMSSQNLPQNLALAAATGANAARMLGRSARVAAWQVVAKVFGSRTAARIGMEKEDINYIHVIAAKNYLPRAAYPGRILYFLPTTISYEYSLPPERGWNPFVSEGVQLIRVNGEPGLSAPETFTKAVGENLRARIEESLPSARKAQHA